MGPLTRYGVGKCVGRVERRSDYAGDSGEVCDEAGERGDGKDVCGAI